MVYDLIIIGGGPAGITAGIYAIRQGLNTLLLTKEFGGQIVKKAAVIENYPGFEEISGLALIQKFEKHLKRQKVEVQIDEVLKIERRRRTDEHFFVRTKSKKIFEARTVLIASGADPRPLEVEGEKEFIGKGVSYCTVCDSSLFAGKTIAVVGGGNSGFEAAIFLSKIAKKIYILETGEKAGADEKNQKAAREIKKIEVITNVFLKKIQGDKFVNSLLYKDKKTGKEISLAVEGVFVEIGYQPATSFVSDLVDFNEKDEIKVNPETLQTTKTSGLFAAGDVTVGKVKQLITAAGEGAKAALAAYNYLQKQK